MIQTKQDIADIIPPAEVQYWPPQPGWYVVGGLLLLLAIVCLLLYLRDKKRNAYRKTAVNALKSIEKLEPFQLQIQKINELLKACILMSYPRNEVAHLVGQQWIDFLNKTSSKIKFNSVQANLLAGSHYQQSIYEELSEEEKSRFMAACETWIKTHKSK